MVEIPRFFQGIFQFEGRGLENVIPLDPPVHYKVPSDRRAQFIYGRVGNPTDEMVYLLVTQNKKPLRYFPVGARDGTNIQLFVIEDLLPDTEVEILIGAPEGLKNKVMIDFGLMEV